MTTVLGYDDHVALAVLSSTGTTTTPIDNLANGQTWSRAIWAADYGDSYDVTAVFSAPQDVDYLGLQGHNFDAATDVLVEVETSPANWVTAANVTNLPSKGPALLRFDQIYNALAVRLTVDQTEPMEIGVMYCGLALDFQQPQMPSFRPPVQSRNVRGYPKVSRLGQFMGRQRERVGWKLQLTQSLVTPAWIDANYVPMMRQIEVKGFFVLWRDDLADQCVFSWLDGEQQAPSYSDPIYLSFALTCQALHDDSVTG